MGGWWQQALTMRSTRRPSRLDDSGKLATGAVPTSERGSRCVSREPRQVVQVVPSRSAVGRSTVRGQCLAVTFIVAGSAGTAYGESVPTVSPLV